MFGDHKGHDVNPIDVAYEKLQARITKSITSGSLNPKQINANVFEVKHVAYLVVEQREKLKQEIHTVFDKIRRACTEREAELQNAIENDAKENIERLTSVEQRWTERYKVSLEILYLVKLLEEKKIAPKDLILGASALYQKLDMLEERISQQEITMHSGADFELPNHELGSLTHEALTVALKTFGALKDTVSVTFKA